MLRKITSRIVCCLNIMFLVIPLDRFTVSTTGFAQSRAWSVPQVIPGYDKEAVPPILIADSNRKVHAFSSQSIMGSDGTSLSSIVYNQWSLNGGWTEPIDIILSPSRDVRLTDAYLDGEGMVDLVFWVGDNTDASIYFSRSELETVDEVQSWSVPVPIVEGAGDPPGAVLRENAEGEWLLIYHGRSFGNGIFVIKSADQGKTWSNPVTIFQTDPSAPFPSDIQVVRSANDWLHVIWDVYTEGGQGRGIYYSKTQNGEEWSEPVLLDYAEEGFGVLTPAIIAYDSKIFAFYSGINLRISLDNGDTWSDPGRIFFRHRGVNGSLSPVIDGSGRLHLFFGQRISGSPDIHGMWHSLWVNNRWTEPEAVTSGPLIVDHDGYNGFDPYGARAVVSQGNTVLVTWRTDYQSRGNGVWYSYKVLDIPETPVILPTPVAPPDTTSTPGSADNMNDAQLTVTDIPVETTQLFDKTRNPVYNFGYLIFLGVLPVIVLIVLLVISKIRYANRL